MFPADSITFTAEILNRKLYFLCSMKRTVEYSGQLFLRQILGFLV